MKKTFLIIFFSIVIGFLGAVNYALAIDAPVLTAPATGAILPRGDVTLRWDPVSDADKGYNYIVIDSDGNRFREQDNYRPTEVTFNVFSLGDYTWRVRACKTRAVFFTDCSSWSERSFTIAIPLEKPIPASPLNGATEISLTPTLQWNWPGDLTVLQRYEVEINGELSTGANQDYLYSTQNYYNIPSSFLLYNRTYSWRVRAQDTNYNYGLWSDPFSFTTRATAPILQPPFLISPIFGQPPVNTLTPSLTWGVRVGARCYELAIIGVWSDKTSATSIPVPAGMLADGGTYNWQARASTEDCAMATTYSDWSGIQTFRIQLSGGGALNCGNGTINPGEQCDGSNLNGQNCISRGFSGGTLGCNSNCTFNTSLCTGMPPGGGGDGGDGECPSGQICNPLKANSFEELVDYLIRFVFYIALALAPLMIIYAGFLWITSAGNPGKIKTASTIILYTAIGLGVILLARGLVAIIKSVLGG